MAAAALSYLLITALLFRNLLPVITTTLAGDFGDPLLNASILAWNARHLPLTTDWWNYPAFAPLSGVTAFTEHLLGAYPITSPIIWTTGNAVLAYNVLLLAGLPLNGIATYALVRELTGSAAGAWIGGLAFAVAPYMSQQLPHVQMLMAYGMPIALLGLHRYASAGRARDLVLFGVGWLLVVLANAYLIAFFPILVALWGAWFLRRADVKRGLAIAATASIATLPVIPLLVGYHLRHAAYGLSRPYSEIELYSAGVRSFAGIAPSAVLWARWLPNTSNEAALFPGFAIVALAVVGVVARRRTALFYLVAAIAMWLLALGPTRGPYWLLLQLPGAQSIRVPARAWLLAVLCLAVCAGFGAAWLARRTRTRWVVALLALLIVAEGWFVAPITKAPTRVRLGLPAGAMVLDLPLLPGDGNADAQYRGVLDDYRVVNGYSGYFPPYRDKLRSTLGDHNPQAFAPFRRRADLYVAIRPEVERPFVIWLEMQPGLERLPDAGTWRVYRLARDGNGPPPPLLLPLPRPGEVALAMP
jgi:hypothetical protein